MKATSDILIFEALTALILAHAMLSGMGTSLQTQILFYGVLLIMNLVCLLFIYTYYKEIFQLVDYNESLTRESFLYIFGGIIGVLIVAIVLSRPYGAQSALYVPIFSSALPVFANVPQVATSVLYNFALVANSEETTKLVGHNALYMYIVTRYPERKEIGKWLSILFPVGFWSSLHAYVAYVGPNVLPLVLAAFFSGLIIFAVMWRTKSLLAAITTHGTYNAIVVSAVTAGWLQVPQASVYPVFLFGYAAVNLILLLLVKVKSK